MSSLNCVCCLDTERKVQAPDGICQMDRSSTDRAWPLFDLAAGIGLLTRLPLPVDPDRARARGAAAAWAWPIVGVIVGVAGWVAGALALALGLAPPVAAALAIGTQIVVTGAMHEDGLADTADGFWGGWTVPRRLAIMKDSHIGTYGVLALMIVTLLRWSALTALFAAADALVALVVAGMLGRAAMAMVMATLPNARGSGLSQAVGRPSRETAAQGAVLALAGAVLLTGPFGIVPMLVGVVVAGAMIGLARAKIGGQTGDVLGATQQVCEVSVLLVLAA